jgi:hypothetical protein
MAGARLGALMAPRFHVDELPHVTLTGIPVPGAYLVRIFHRTTPVAEAVMHVAKRPPRRAPNAGRQPASSRAIPS